MTLLETKSLCIGYSRTSKMVVLQKDINISVSKGEIVSLMGQNGVGKTTFIKTITGLLLPISGDVFYNDTRLAEMPPNRLAQQVSLVLTERPSNLNMTPIELISIARHPYSNWMGILDQQDKEVIEWALSETNTNYIANKKLYELSDGQLQKVMIARALTQETQLIILDEPGSHLDLNNKIEVMLLLRKIARKGIGILISTHDLQVSTQLSDKLLLFNFNEAVNEGVPEDLILDETLQKGLYLNKHGYDMIYGTLDPSNQGVGVKVSGHPETTFWVERALSRKGFRVQSEKPEFEVICKTKDLLVIKSKKKTEEVNNVRELLNKLT